MKADSTVPSQLAAFAIVAAPGVIVLAALVGFGVLDWLYGLLGGICVLAGLGLVLSRHFLRIEALRHAVEALGRNEPEAMPALRRATRPMLSPGLETAVAETARQQVAARRQLEAVVAGNEAILASLPDPLVMLDGSRRIVRANPATRELLGRDVAGRNLADVLRNPQLLEAADAVLAGEDGRIVEFTLPGNLELYFWANVTGLPHPAPDGTGRWDDG